MASTSEFAKDDSSPAGSRWARSTVARDENDAREALQELAAEYWYCAYAWWRRVGYDADQAAAATVACFTRWLTEAPPSVTDSGAARMREWLPARLAELAAEGLNLDTPAELDIDAAWAERRYADEPDGEPDAIFQRRWAITVIEFTASTLQAEYAARGEDALFVELLPFAGFEAGDEDRYSAAAARTGRTSGAMRRAVFDFRTRQRELLQAFVADTLLDPAETGREITALLCACDAPGPQAAAAPLPTAIESLRPDEILARAMQSVRMTHMGHGGWEAPTIAEAAALFPQYEVLGLLGRGGMGAVYRARQPALDRLVAIKLLPLEVSVDQDFAERFVREARAMAKLNHPNIIAVHDFGTTSEGHLFFVMEYVEGANLHDMIHGPGIDPAQALEIVAGTCDALAYAHAKGVVHRDIKPANVMVSVEGHVKVADFGLARLTDPAAEPLGHTVTGTVMGTPDYMAPEQKRGMNVDHRADIYSLGVMLYEMLCRETPQGVFDPPSARVPGVDARVDQVVVKAMHQQPERRYQSTQEMKTEVAAARTPLSVAPSEPAAPVPRVDARQSLARPAETPAPAKSKTPMFIGVAALLAAVVGGWVFLGKAKTPRESEAASGPQAVATASTKTDGLPARGLEPATEVDLLALVDPLRDAEKGLWEKTQSELKLQGGDRERLLMFPYAAPAEYDFEFEFTVLSDSTEIGAVLSLPHGPIMWKMGMVPKSSRSDPAKGIDGKTATLFAFGPFLDRRDPWIATGSKSPAIARPPLKRGRVIGA